MSRCFPYPPPGYAGKVARTEAALIDSIKLQSERQQSKHDKKKEKSKHKKEKSERSKDKKQRRKESKERKEKSSRSCDLNDQKQKECAKEAKDVLKGTKVESEQVEKSGLTEEHGQPVWPQSPGYLSDGTQINHKRKRDAGSQPNEGCKPGKIIRIKLASSVSNQEDSADTQQTCSTSGRDNCVDQKRDENSRGPIQQETCFTNSDAVVAVKEAAPKIKEQPHPVHAAKDIRPRGNAVPLPPRTRTPAESAYEALFEKWGPPPLQLEQQTDDEEWLFGTRKQDGQTTKTTNNKAFSPVPSCRSLSLWPRGQYLPDADVYSLPYTIPF